MKLFLFLLLMGCGSSIAHAQAKNNDDFIKMRGRLPWPADNIIELVNQTFLLKGSKKTFHHSLPTPILTIRFDKATIVKAAADGIVHSVFAIENAWSVLIRYGSYYLGYSNLDSVFLKKGDTICARQPVGKITTPGLNNCFELDVLMYRNTEQLAPYDWFMPSQRSKLVL